MTRLVSFSSTAAALEVRGSKVEGVQPGRGAVEVLRRVVVGRNSERDIARYGVYVCVLVQDISYIKN